jgi:hypothetical protein
MIVYGFQPYRSQRGEQPRYPSPVLRYQSRAYGTREEIIKALQGRASGTGSARRQEEARQAINELEKGATVVNTQSFQFVVVGEPLDYLVELTDGTIEKVTALCDTDAWSQAHALLRNRRPALELVGGPNAPVRVKRLFRDVTRDET